MSTRRPHRLFFLTAILIANASMRCSAAFAGVVSSCRSVLASGLRTRGSSSHRRTISDSYSSIASRRCAASFFFCPERGNFRLYSQSPAGIRDEGDPASSRATNADDAIDRDVQTRRLDALHESLKSLGVDTDALSDAAFRSVATTEGFDGRFGKSAIKTYRTFVNPRPSKEAAAREEDPVVAAGRCARQIDFLARRHRSHEAEWVRHTDVEDGAEGRRTFPLYLVLDNVRSALNVGSLFRTADACGCAEILTTGITPHPRGSGAEKVAKSALGAERIVASRHFDSTRGALEALREERPNVRLVGMETTEWSRGYAEVLYPGGEWVRAEEERKEGGGILAETPGVALFLGNEVTGVDTEILSLLDEVVEIPMFGAKNSLNVAACAPVVMYEILRQWGVVAAPKGSGDEAR